MSVGLHCGMAPAYQRLVSFGLGGGQPKGRQIDLSSLFLAVACLVILTASSSFKLLLYRFWGSPPLATHRMPLLTPAVLLFSAAALRERTDFYRDSWARLPLTLFFCEALVETAADTPCSQSTACVLILGGQHCTASTRPSFAYNLVPEPAFEACTVLFATRTHTFSLVMLTMLRNQVNLARQPSRLFTYGSSGRQSLTAGWVIVEAATKARKLVYAV